MKRNVEFLNYIYENARMGVIGIKDLMPKVKHEDFVKLLETELKEYEIICDECIKHFIKFKACEKDVSKMAKIMTYINVQISDTNDISKLAKLMINGSNKGIIEITEQLNNYHNGDEDLIKLANKLLETEQNNLEELKKYL